MGGTQSTEDEEDTPETRQEEISKTQPQNEPTETNLRTNSRLSSRPLQQQREMGDNVQLGDVDSQSSPRHYPPSTGFQENDDDEDDDDDDESFVLARQYLDPLEQTVPKTLDDSDTGEGGLRPHVHHSSSQGRTSPAGSEANDVLRMVANPSETGSRFSSVSTVTSGQDSHPLGRDMRRGVTVNNDSDFSDASQPHERGLMRSTSAAMDNPSSHDSMPFSPSDAARQRFERGLRDMRHLGSATINNPSNQDSVSPNDVDRQRFERLRLREIMRSASATMNNPSNHYYVPEMMRSASATIDRPSSEDSVSPRDDSYLYGRDVHGGTRPGMDTLRQEGVSPGRPGYSPPWARNGNGPEGQSDTGSQREEAEHRYQAGRVRELRGGRGYEREEEEIRRHLEHPRQPYGLRPPPFHREEARRGFLEGPDSQQQFFVCDDLGIPRESVSQSSLQEQPQALGHIPLFSSSQDLRSAGLRRRGVTGAVDPQPSARPVALNPNMVEPYLEEHNPQRSQAYPHGHNHFRSRTEPYPEGHNNPFRSPSDPYPEPHNNPFRPPLEPYPEGYNNPFRSPTEPYPEGLNNPFRSPPEPRSPTEPYPEGHNNPFGSPQEPYPEGNNNPFRSPPEPYPEGHNNPFRSPTELYPVRHNNPFRVQPCPAGQSAGLARNLSYGSEPLQPYLRSPSSSEVSETLCETGSAKVLVKGVSRKTSRETLRMYFENTTRSDGGPVSDVRLDKTTGRCRVTFESAEVARNVVSKKQHIVDEKVITVTFDQSAARSIGSQRNVVVQNFKKNTTSEELLRTYFEDPARSGGGEVTDVKMYRSKRGSAVVCFRNETDARNVLTVKHVLNWTPLRVCLFEESYALSSVFCLGGLKGGQRFNQDLAEDLVNFVEGQTQCPVYDVCFGSKSAREGTALVIFEDDLDMLELQQALASTNFKGHKLRVRRVSVSRTAEVHNLPPSAALCEETLTHYFENTRQSGGENVLEVSISRNRQYALVTFADPEVCCNVVNRSQVLRSVQLHVQTYFDCVGTCLDY